VGTVQASGAQVLRCSGALSPSASGCQMDTAPPQSYTPPHFLSFKEARWKALALTCTSQIHSAQAG